VKSLVPSLPVFGRLAYPVRVEATIHDMPNVDPAALQQYAPAVGPILVGEANFESEQSRISCILVTTGLREVLIRGTKRGKADPFFSLGKADDLVKKQVRAHGWVPPGTGSLPRKDFSEDNVRESSRGSRDCVQPARNLAGKRPKCLH